jgi:hypothetical protein
MSKRLKRGLYLFLLIAFFVSCQTVNVSAEPSQSTNYRFNESSIGSGGLIQSSSANYQGRDSLGDIGVGNASSSNFQIDAGSTTTDDPALSVAINGTVNFGDFTATSATTTTTTFTVLNYTTYGYIVQIVGDTPSSGSTTLAPMTTTGPSVAGTSQFGINLVANTLPTSVGANPDNGQFGFGTVAGNYNTSNSYRYVSGETIAQATRNSGVTTYTITYLVNVPALTPGGLYTSNQTLIVTGTY